MTWHDDLREYYKSFRRYYFICYVLISATTLGIILAQGYFCFSQNDQQCVSVACNQKQRACEAHIATMVKSPDTTDYRVQNCCWNGSQLACHYRLLFCFVCYFCLLTSIVDDAFTHHAFEIEQAFEIDSKNVAETAFVVGTFCDKVRTVWGVIILMGVYLSHSPTAYFATLLDGSICKADFNAAFCTQLLFVPLDNIIEFLWFVVDNAAYMAVPLPAHMLLERTLAGSNAAEAADGDPYLLRKAARRDHDHTV